MLVQLALVQVVLAQLALVQLVPLLQLVNLDLLAQLALVTLQAFVLVLDLPDHQLPSMSQGLGFQTQDCRGCVLSGLKSKM